MGEQETNGLRKSAIVLLSLGEQHAWDIVRRLDATAAEMVRAEMRRVGELRRVSLATRQWILGEFCDAAIGAMSAPVAPTSSSAPMNESQSSPQAPFASLHNAGADSLLDSIRDEHPQTIALVLAHLPADKAGDVLAGLDHHRKVEVIKRIAGIEQTSSQVIEQVEQGLRQRLGAVMGKTVRTGGVGAVAEILNSADDAVEQEILDDLSEEAPDLVEEIRRVQAIFEDLLLASDEDMRSVIEQLDHATIVMALRTAGGPLRQKVLWNVAPEQAELIERELDELTPASVGDIEAAQQRVAEIVHRLDCAGEIKVIDRRDPPLDPEEDESGDRDDDLGDDLDGGQARRAG
jgi:flagellar motor switch protein FliG